MYRVTKYPHGAFSWVENTSTDPATAKAFYLDLFGWGSYDIPINENMSYTMFTLEGENVAALNGMMPDIQAQGIPSFWGNYVTVDDVAPLADVITENGGAILVGPMDVFDSGSMIFLMDPTGAHLGLWQPKNRIGAGIVNKPGALTWNDLLTKDLAAAQAFYSAVLGWEFVEASKGYLHIINRGRRNGGMMQMDENFGAMPSVWQTYFAVADIDESIKRAQELGGSIVIPKMEIPEGGHFSLVRDPAGAHFNISQTPEADPWVE